LSIALMPGIGVAGTYIGILLVYCFLQVGSNTTQASYQPLLPELVPENMRGIASGVKSLLEVLGGVALTRLTAYFMGSYYAGGGEKWLWRSLYALMGVLLIAMIITLLSVKQPPSKSRIPFSFSLIMRSLKVDFKVHRNFAWFLVSRALLGLPGVSLQIFAIYYLMDVVGMQNPASVAGDLLVVVGICLIATAYPTGRLSDKIGRRPIILSSGILGALGVLVLFLSQNYIQVMISGALLGVANGAMLSGTWALATDLAVKGEEAKYLGITNLAMAGGSALARLIGPVIDFFNGLRPNSGYQVMLLICFVCFIAGGLLVMKVKPNQS
jgi:MFS family permease